MKQHLLKNSLLRGVLCLLLCIVGIGNAWGEEVTVTFDASKQGYTNGQVITNVTITEGINVVFNKGTNSNNCKYYTTGTAIRVYGGGYFTIASTIGKIIKIKFTFGSDDGSNSISKNCGTYHSTDGIWEGYSESITFTINGTSGHRKIKDIAVTYEKDANAPIMEHIAISGTPAKTSYYIDEKPSANGLTVSAVYSDDSETDITDFVTWTFSPETITEETTQVTATASYNGLVASHTYSIIATIDPRIKDYTLLENGKKYYIGATLSNGTDYYFSTTYTSTTNAVKGVAQTDKANANILTAIANSSDKTKWAFQFENGYYLSLKDSQDNGMVRIIAPKTYWELSNTTKGLVNMTTNGFCLQRNNSATITNFGSYKNTQTDIWFIEVPTYDVEISSAGYATFCLPYNAIVPEGMTAYTATDNGESVKLTAKESNKIAAGEGVILKGKEGTYTFVAAEGNVNATESNQLVGVTKDTQLSASDNAYMLTRDKNTNAIAFRRLATTTPYTLSANKAYLKLNEGDESRQLISVTWDDNATSIYKLKGKKDVHDGAIYNLAGQKLIHTQKGINIINGKLVIK